MKGFLIKTARFLGGLLAFVVALLLFNRYAVDWRAAPEDRMVVVGTSVPAHAYDPALIPGLANLGFDGECYFYSYYKLKRFLRSNPGVKTVWIEFNNSDLSDVKDDWIWGDKFVADKVPKYALDIDAQGYGLIWRGNEAPLRLIPALAKGSMRQCFQILARGRSYTDAEIGGFVPIRMNRTTEIKEEMERTGALWEADDLPYNGISTANLEYLRRMVSHCREQGLAVYLVRTPMHHLFIDYRYEQAFLKYYREHFADVEFLDFRAFPLTDQEYADMSHLNADGAERYSKWMNGLLADGLLEQAAKQEYIDQAMARVKR